MMCFPGIHIAALDGIVHHLIPDAETTACRPVEKGAGIWRDLKNWPPSISGRDKDRLGQEFSG